MLSAVPEPLRLLADETRWRLLALLRQGDYQVGELVSQLGLSQNLVSYHLGVLRQGGLVLTHRSDADGRATYYGLDLEALKTIYAQIGTLLYVSQHEAVAKLPPATVFFFCTANSARSQMAEAWMRHLSHGRITVRSAGTQPTRLHPLTVEVMHEVGLDIGYQTAKHLDSLADLQPDLIVTVCDIAREHCVRWGEAVRQIHWSVADPVLVTGTPDEQRRAFRTVRDELRSRVEGLLHLLPSA